MTDTMKARQLREATARAKAMFKADPTAVRVGFTLGNEEFVFTRGSSMPLLATVRELPEYASPRSSR